MQSYNYLIWMEKHLSDVGSRQYITGITKFDKNHFVTGGSDGLIHFWKLCGNDIKCLDKTFHEESKIFGICYNGTFFGVLHHTDDLINVLDSQGRKVRKIVLNEAFGKKIKFGFDIHMDIATHNIYVPCVNHTYGVLCMSVEGEPLWFSPLIGIPRGITEAHGVLCVANNTKKMHASDFQEWGTQRKAHGWYRRLSRVCLLWQWRK